MAVLVIVCVFCPGWVVGQCTTRHCSNDQGDGTDLAATVSQLQNSVERLQQQVVQQQEQFTEQGEKLIEQQEKVVKLEETTRSPRNESMLSTMLQLQNSVEELQQQMAKQNATLTKQEKVIDVLQIASMSFIYLDVMLHVLVYPGKGRFA